MTKRAQNILNIVLSYCTETGLIDRLKESLKIPEEDRYSQRDIDKNGLHLLDAVHCVYDKSRTKFFLEEINRIVKPGMKVLEAGIGTGVLAFESAKIGAKITGIEINGLILSLAQAIRKELFEKKILVQENNIKFIKQDAIRVRFKEKFDVLISENIYTGMFFEKQVQIVQNLAKYLKPKGRVIPSKLNSYIAVCQATLPAKYKHQELFIPSPDSIPNVKFKALSKFVEYDEINFEAKMSNSVSSNSIVTIMKDGTINGVAIYSEVGMPSGMRIKRNSTSFLNNDIILGIKPAIAVLKGDRLTIKFSYKYGASPVDATLEIKQLIATKK